MSTVLRSDHKADNNIAQAYDQPYVTISCDICTKLTSLFYRPSRKERKEELGNMKDVKDDTCTYVALFKDLEPEDEEGWRWRIDEGKEFVGDEGQDSA
jgi:hypothetical protein